MGGVIGFKLGSGQKVIVLSKLATSIPQVSRVLNAKVPEDKTGKVDFTQFWEV